MKFARGQSEREPKPHKLLALFSMPFFLTSYSFLTHLQPCSSDFENKFVCGEIMAYDDLKEHGSEAAVKAAGKLRQQGKPYESTCHSNSQHVYVVSVY
jgi:Protein of unknown function (DUF933)